MEIPPGGTKCPHTEFAVHADVHRLVKGEDDDTVTGYSVDVKVACAQCREPFCWRGVAIGASPRHPMTSVDGAELRAPIYPSSGNPDFGADGPGFSVVAFERAGELVTVENDDD